MVIIPDCLSGDRGSIPLEVANKYLMGNFLKYLDDIPILNDSLIHEVYESLKNETTFYRKNNRSYQIFEATDELKKFTKSIFNFDHVTNVQRIVNSLNIHKDYGRIQAYNYMIENGGDNVQTCFFDDQFQLLEKYNIENHRWHCLDVSVYHNVINVESTRIALTVHVNV